MFTSNDLYIFLYKIILYFIGKIGLSSFLSFSIMRFKYDTSYLIMWKNHLKKFREIFYSYTGVQKEYKRKVCLNNIYSFANHKSIFNFFALTGRWNY